MKASRPAELGPPPASVSSRYRHSPLWRVLGGVADVGVAVLDRTQPVQRFLNRNPRQLPVVHDRTPVVVRDRRTVAEDQDVVQLTLSADRGTAMLPWHPGAHIDVFLPSGRKRQYSLCGDPDNVTEYRIAVRRIPGGGGGSIEMHELAVGDRFEISAPRNAFYLALPGAGSTCSRVRFVAGGIGITPILPMLRVADSSGVDWSLLYTGRHQSSLPFLDELAAYGGRVTVRTDDQHGLPTASDLLDNVDRSTAIYICGPPPMVSVIRAALPARSRAELHCERFSPPPVEGGRPFEIQLARSGQLVEVGADESALAAIRRHKPDVAYSCQQGFCGTCIQKVLAGDVDHRDRLLTDLQRDSGRMLVCVSRADTRRLVLDL